MWYILSWIKKFLLTFRPGFLFCGITQDTLTWENSESKSFQSCRIQSQSRLITCLEIVHSNKNGPDDDDNYACKMTVMMVIMIMMVMIAWWCWWWVSGNGDKCITWLIKNLSEGVRRIDMNEPTWYNCYTHGAEQQACFL